MSGSKRESWNKKRVMEQCGGTRKAFMPPFPAAIINKMNEALSFFYPLVNKTPLTTKQPSHNC